MTVAIFLLAAIAAAAFVVRPVFARTRARLLLSAALAVFVIGIGAGMYLAVGRPALALHDDGTAGLVRRLHESPNDLAGWKRLGESYLRAGADDQAAKAYLRAIQVARATGKPREAPYSDYGATLVGLSPGVPAEAENAFRVALFVNPKDPVALYFMGFASAARGEAAQAIALWQALLDESPPNAPYRKGLTARIAMLKGQGTPDIDAMVAGLAARLKTQPDDAEGWQKLVRSYAVLKDMPRAQAALADARAAMAKNPDALKALAAEAKELGLEK
ncbi:MAG TPA: hypothetical protein VG889_05930 [Rhizomicrobium sp.]|nr:hypothetical protein [Rhizomicrobium sp.]